MSEWRAKYPNDCGEYEITFASLDSNKAKAVEKLCQAIIDNRVKGSDDYAVAVRCRDCIGKEHWYWHKTGCNVCGMSNLYNVEDNDFCCYGERKAE